MWESQDNVWVATCVNRLLMGTYLKGTFYDEGNDDLADKLRLFYGGISEEIIQRSMQSGATSQRSDPGLSVPEP